MKPGKDREKEVHFVGKPRYNWWPFALNMVRDYPQRLREYKELKSQKVTASAEGAASGGSGASRVTERLAMRCLPPQEQREFDAVRGALEQTRLQSEGKIRCEVVKLTLWKGYTLDGAARLCGISRDTARRYRWRFLLTVGLRYGFLEEPEYREAIRRDQYGTDRGKSRNPRAKKV